ncbi:MAG: hypothetical protein JSW52_00355 [Candidatus Coatesbacteria bacterium]|nr:MAG: hypothetical protein JSW52_00355 [Candidatus Coatesbacteria bacterium]
MKRGIVFLTAASAAVFATAAAGDTPQILDDDDFTTLSNFDESDIKISPEDSFEDEDPTRPLVILIHGFHGSLTDMVDPLSDHDRRESIFAYDLDWEPEIEDLGEYRTPPLGFDLDLTYPVGIARFVDELRMLGITLLNPTLNTDWPAFLEDAAETFGADFVASPLVDPDDITPDPEDPDDITPDPSWFDYLVSQGYPVLAYRQGGSVHRDLHKRPLGKYDEGGAYEEFLGIMEDVHENLRTEENGELSGYRRIALIGQSRGGIIARRYVVDALNGDLPPPHEEIVVKRVRFLGTLNTPHFGDNLSEIPHLLELLIVTFSHGIAAGWANEIVDILADWLEVDVGAVNELRPRSTMIVNMNRTDFQLMLTDGRMGRVRRASTSGNEPALRRFFLMVYTPESFMGEIILDAPSFLPPYSHKKEPFELPFSPFLEGKGRDFSVWEIAEAGLLVQPPVTVVAELRADGRDAIYQNYSPGGDVIVSHLSGWMLGTAPDGTLANALEATELDELLAISAMTPINLGELVGFGRHRTISRQHYATLWHPDYKTFIEPRIPKCYLYPWLTVKAGDNVAEISWDPLPNPYNNYKVVRFTDGAVGERSEEITETIFYDPVWTIAPLKYLVTYPIGDGGWAPPDELEAERAGSLPVTIKRCRLNDDVPYDDLVMLNAKMASAPVEDRFVLLGATPHSVVSDSFHSSVPVIISSGSSPPPARSIVFESDYWPVSEPYMTSEGEEVALAAWLEFGFPSKTESIPDPPDLDEEGLGGYDPGGGGGSIAFGDLDKTKIWFRLYGAYIDSAGLPVVTPELGGNTEVINSRQLECIESPTTTLESPRIAVFDDHFLFAFTAGSSHTLYLVETDRALNLAGDPTLDEVVIRGQPGVEVVEEGLSGEGLLGEGLILHDFFRFGDSGWIALVGLEYTDTLYVATDNGAGTRAISELETRWPLNTRAGCKGAVLGSEEDGYTLLIFPSYESVIETKKPTFGSVVLPSAGEIAADVDWGHDFTLPDVPDEVHIFAYHDIVQRCPKKVDLLVSSSGYFADDRISSSLYRISVRQYIAPYVETVHHSAYGPYLVTFTRSEVIVDDVAAFWQPQTIWGSPFRGGVYGQRLLSGIAECPISALVVPGAFHVGGIPPEMILEAIEKYGIPLWSPLSPPDGPGDGVGPSPLPILLGELMADADLRLRLIQNDELRTPTLTVIYELDHFARVNRSFLGKREGAAKTREVAVRRLRKRTFSWLDAVYLAGDAELIKVCAPIIESVGWQPPERRAEEMIRAVNPHLGEK